MDGGLAQASPSMSVPLANVALPAPMQGELGAQMRRVGQLRVGADVAGTVGGHGRRATVVEGAGRVIVAPIGGRVEIDDTVVQRAIGSPAARAVPQIGAAGLARRKRYWPSCRSTCSCSACLICPAAVDRRVAGQGAAVERAVIGPAAGAAADRTPSAEVVGQRAVVQRATVGPAAVGGRVAPQRAVVERASR